MKKSYLVSGSNNGTAGAGTGGITNNSSATLGGYSSASANSSPTQGYSAGSYGTKYRLASLDRLAHRKDDTRKTEAD